MRGNTLIAVLGLAVLVGATIGAEAQQPGAANRGGGGGGNQIESFDRGAGDAENRRRPCYVVGATSIDCPPKKKFVQILPPKEDDCECKLKAVLVGGRTKIVKDCYQETKVDGVKRIRYCEIPEKE